MRSLTPILEEGVFSLRFGCLATDISEESLMCRMGVKNVGTKSISCSLMPCSVPLASSPIPVSRRNSGPVCPAGCGNGGRGHDESSPQDELRSPNRQQQQQSQQQQGGRDGHRRLDRCHSEPTSCGNRSSSRSSSSTSSRYKTELCRAFAESSRCKYGEKCQFAHGLEELRTVQRHRKYKTELCRTFHTDGFCPYGARCHFIHSNEARPSSSNFMNATPSMPVGRSLSVASSSSLTSSPTHSDSLSESPTSTYAMFWNNSDDELPQTPTSNNVHHDFDIFMSSAKPSAPSNNNGVNFVNNNNTININNNNSSSCVNQNAPLPSTHFAGTTKEYNDMLVAAAIAGAAIPRLPVFSRLATVDTNDPADR